MTDSSASAAPEARISRRELIALIAMLMSTVAFATDAMLPALPYIAEDVGGGDVTRAALIIASFMMGMGLGTLFAGPMSDAYGRQPIAIGGATIFIISALVCAFVQSIEALLIARFLQGIGASGPRIAAMAIVRDLYSGRQMARTLSFVMMVFTIVPVLAPIMGAMIAWAFDWRGIFIAFALFSATSIIWLKLRLEETHSPDLRRPFRLQTLWNGIKEVLLNRTVVRAILAQSLVYSVLFVALMTSQPVIDQVFGYGASFHYWFAAVALFAASASFLNAAVVVRVGMVRVVQVSLGTVAGFACLYATFLMMTPNGSTVGFALYLVLICAAFCLAGLCIGNLNAIAMQPMAHIAGLAASTISAISTSLGALVAAPASLFFDGTAVPATLCVAISAAFAWLLARKLSETTEDIPA